MKSINIALTTSSPAWKNYLEQEKYPFIEIESKDDNIEHPVVICDSTSDNEFCSIEEAVKNGSVAIVTSLYYSQHFTASLFSEHVSSIIPEKESIFASLESLQLNSYIFYIPTIDFLDKKLRVSYHKHGEGYFIILPFELDDLFSNHSIKRQKFYDERDELPSERVSIISKGHIRQFLNMIVKYSYELTGLPLVQINYFPGNWNNIFCFRVDTDFCSSDQAEGLYRLCRKYNINATWFVDTKDPDRLHNCYAQFDNQEIGLHCFRHLVFDSFKENRDNIDKGLKALDEAGIQVNGFAAPFGEWNETLDQALQERDLFYSSEFGFDYDNFPAKYTAKSPWQIPIHPISLGRLRRSHYSKVEMMKYFRNMVQHHVNKKLPIIIYYHPHREMLDQIDDIFKNVSEQEIPVLSMLEYAQWWHYRNSIKFQAYLNHDELIIDSNTEPEKVGLIIQTSDGYAKHEFSKKIILKELYLKQEAKNTVPEDYERIYKFQWRDLLYDYESKKGKRKQ